MQFQGHKLVFRRYAHLFFIMCIDEGDNELAALESIHLFVEVLDNFFTSVTELDIVLNFHKVRTEACHDAQAGCAIGAAFRLQEDAAQASEMHSEIPGAARPQASERRGLIVQSQIRSHNQKFACSVTLTAWYAGIPHPR
jgi:Clathrin adaptor complex small chain